MCLYIIFFVYLYTLHKWFFFICIYHLKRDSYLVMLKLSYIVYLNQVSITYKNYLVAVFSLIKVILSIIRVIRITKCHLIFVAFLLMYYYSCSEKRCRFVLLDSIKNKNWKVPIPANEVMRKIKQLLILCVMEAYLSCK